MCFNEVVDLIINCKDSSDSASRSFDKIVDMASCIYASDKFSDVEKKEIHTIICAMYNQLDD